MKGKRSKQYRKLMEKYNFNFGFREPYQVLIDAQIIQDAARCKMRLGSLLEGTLHAKEIKPMITQCCIRHLYTAPTTTDEEKRAKEAWIEVAKAAERRRCGHHELDEPLSTLDCMLSVVDPKGSGTNKHRYVVATQDQDVRRRMREIAGVPLVYINRSVMILEPMAARSEKVREADEKGKIRAGLKGRRPAASSAMKRKRDDEDGDEDMPDRARAMLAAEANGGSAIGASDAPAPKKQRKVKGPKGPNPMSVKKAKKEAPKPSAAREVEDERSVIRKAKKSDPQAAEKAVDAEVATQETGPVSLTEGLKKRKRKRKTKEAQTVTGDGDGPGIDTAVGGAEEPL